MTNRDRFLKVLNFQPVDRLPAIEWATWWDQTLDRWRGEGLPEEACTHDGLFEYFGLDLHLQHWISTTAPTCPGPAGHGLPLMSTSEDYEALLPHLYPEQALDVEVPKAWAPRQAAGAAAVWLTLEGFFWFPRRLFGIEPHLFAFYDRPDLMRRINDDLLAFNLRVLDEFCGHCVPDFMTFAEDMSYNHGPMISKLMFDEFIAPYYRVMTEALHRHGILVIVDTDGQFSPAAPWFRDVGVDGFLPLERRAGVDPRQLRAADPRMLLIGGFDKTVMHLGRDAVRAEFEHLLPVMRQGGFLPSVDHQTPPGVSLQQYKDYVELLREYCERAGGGTM
jgi:hypothetical protein